MTATQTLSFTQTTGFAFESNDFAMNCAQTCIAFEPQHPLQIGEWDEYGENNEDADDESIPPKIDPDLEDDDELDEDDEFDVDEEISGDDDDEFEKYLHGDDDE